MANCEAIQIELSAYLDGEVPPADRATLEAHLRDCAACRDALNELESARNALAELPRLKAPKSLAAAIKRNLSETDNGSSLPIAGSAATASANVVTFEPRRMNSPWRPAILGIAAMVMAAVLIFLLLPLITKEASRKTAMQDSPKAATKNIAAPHAAPAPARTELAETRKDAQSAAPAAVAAAPQEPQKELAEETLSKRSVREEDGKNAPAGAMNPGAPPVTQKPSAPRLTGDSPNDETGDPGEKLDRAQQQKLALSNKQSTQAQRNLARNAEEWAAKAPEKATQLGHAAPVEEQRSNEGKPGYQAPRKDEKPADYKSADSSPANNASGPFRGGSSNAGAKAPGHAGNDEDESTPPRAPVPKPASKYDDQLANERDQVAREKKGAITGRVPAPQTPPPGPTPTPAPKPAQQLAPPGSPAKPKTGAGEANKATEPDAANANGIGNGPGGGARGFVAGANEEDGRGDGAGMGSTVEKKARGLEDRERDRLDFGSPMAGRQRLSCRESELPALLDKLQRLAESSGGKLNAPPEAPEAEKATADAGDKKLKAEASGRLSPPAATAAPRARRERSIVVTLTVHGADREIVLNHIKELAADLRDDKAAEDAEGKLAQRNVDKNTAKKDDVSENLLGKEAEAKPDQAKSVKEPLGETTITIEIITTR